MLNGSVLQGLVITVPLGVPMFVLACLAFGGFPALAAFSTESWAWMILAGVLHFALGRYSEANGRLKVEVTVTNYRDGTAFFGKNEPVFRVNLSGEINGPTVTGEASDLELKYSIPVRMVKVGDL